MMDTHLELYNAIKSHCELEDESILQAAEHGADAGWNGFTYYTDTCKFCEDNEHLIYDLLNEMADGMGLDSPDALVATFNCDTSSPDARKNALAWFALEEVGRWLEDNPQEENDESE